MVERLKEADRYLYVPISQERLKSFKLGEIDLKYLYTNPPTDDLYMVLSEDIFHRTLSLNHIPSNEVPDSWLPEEGFFFEEEPKYDELIKNQARERHSPILHLDLNPPEAREANKISPENLAKMLTTFQALIKYAFKSAISKLKPEIKKSLDIPMNYRFDVVSTSRGSFTVHLQLKRRADLFGYSDIERAFKIIDNLSEDLSDQKELLEKIKQYKGHCANSYLKLLETVVQNDMPISYSWILPGIDKVKTRAIYKQQAKFAYESLISTEELTTETMELIGRIIKADHKTGKWTLISEEDKKEYRGELSEKSEVTLEGMVIKSQIYKFFCEETIEEITGTGREKKRLVLIKYEVLD